MRVLGFLLLLFGVVALVYGGITYDRERTVLDVGPLRAIATEKKTVPLSPIAGGIAVIGGVLLLILPKKRAS